MIILIDTREQRPIKFGAIDCRNWTLKEGDYTTTVLLNDFHIERKSPQDLYGSLIQGHMRFRRMLMRASSKGVEIVVFVECTQRVFENKFWPQGSKRKCSSSTLKKIIVTMQRHYDLEFVWCKNRLDMRRKILARLYKEEKKLKQ